MSFYINGKIALFIATIISLVLSALKIAHQIDWSWWVVLAPVIVVPVVFGVVFLFILYVVFRGME